MLCIAGALLWGAFWSRGGVGVVKAGGLSRRIIAGGRAGAGQGTRLAWRRSVSCTAHRECPDHASLLQAGGALRHAGVRAGQRLTLMAINYNQPAACRAQVGCVTE